MHTSTLGIDVAQATLACCLTDGQRQYRHTAPNTPDGFQALHAWVRARVETPLPVVMEATGGYEEAVATYFADQGWTVYCVNPYRIRRWAESELIRLKNDTVDAAVIAAFGRTATKLHPWQPVAAPYRTLRQLVRLHDDLQSTCQAYQNRLGAPGHGETVTGHLRSVLQALKEELATLEQAIHTALRDDPALWANYQVLCSIPGIAHTTAVVLLAEVGDTRQFRSAKQLVAFAGLSVEEATSGTSVHKRPRLSKRGAPRLRSALYFPAMTAQRHNPHFAALAQRLANAPGNGRAKTPMQILGALMRKLLELVYALLRDQQPFSAAYRHPRAIPPMEEQCVPTAPAGSAPPPPPSVRPRTRCRTAPSSPQLAVT